MLGISIRKYSTRTSQVPLGLCVLIISHFLAFSCASLSYFIDVNKDILIVAHN